MKQVQKVKLIVSCTQQSSGTLTRSRIFSKETACSFLTLSVLVFSSKSATVHYQELSYSACIYFSTAVDGGRVFDDEEFFCQAQFAPSRTRLIVIRLAFFLVFASRWCSSHCFSWVSRLAWITLLMFRKPLLTRPSLFEHGFSQAYNVWTWGSIF